MQETWVWSPIWEDPRCLGATRPVYHNCWALCFRTTKKPQLLNTWMHYWSPHTLEAVLHNKRRHHNEKPKRHNWRLAPDHCNQRKACIAMQTPHRQKISKFFFFFFFKKHNIVKHLYSKKCFLKTDSGKIKLSIKLKVPLTIHTVFIAKD